MILEILWCHVVNELFLYVAVIVNEYFCWLLHFYTIALID